MENIITEFRVIEIDEGFRIEIKGNKERIRSFIDHFNDPSDRRWHRRPGPGFGWSPWGVHPMMWASIASCWGPKEEKTEESNRA